jgi:hypothetical protein
MERMFRCVSRPIAAGAFIELLNLPLISLKESSEITIHLFHVDSSSKEQALGTVAVAAKELVTLSTDPIRTPNFSFEVETVVSDFGGADREYKIDQTSRLGLQSAIVVLVLRRKPEQPPSLAPLPSVGKPTREVSAKLERACRGESCEHQKLRRTSCGRHHNRNVFGHLQYRPWIRGQSGAVRRC